MGVVESHDSSSGVGNSPRREFQAKRPDEESKAKTAAREEVSQSERSPLDPFDSAFAPIRFVRTWLSNRLRTYQLNSGPIAAPSSRPIRHLLRRAPTPMAMPPLTRRISVGSGTGVHCNATPFPTTAGIVLNDPKFVQAELLITKVVRPRGSLPFRLSQ